LPQITLLALFHLSFHIAYHSCLRMASVIARSMVVMLILCATSVIASRINSRSSYAVKDSHSIPRRWTRVGPASPLHLIQLQIGLRQSNFSELQRHLYEGEWQPISCIDFDVQEFILRELWASLLIKAYSLWSRPYSIWPVPYCRGGESSCQTHRWNPRASSRMASRGEH
jgi:hypothetical protein